MLNAGTGYGEQGEVVGTEQPAPVDEEAATTAEVRFAALRKAAGLDDRPLREIADELGVSHVAVHKAVKKIEERCFGTKAGGGK